MLSCLLQSLPHLLLSNEWIKVEITTVFGNLTFRALALRQREICPDEAKKSAFKPFRVLVRPLSTRFDKNKIFMFHPPTDAAAQFLYKLEFYLFYRIDDRTRWPVKRKQNLNLFDFFAALQQDDAVVLVISQFSDLKDYPY